MSWTKGVIFEFLELFRCEQVLWDPKHPLRKYRCELTAAWNRIQASLSVHCSINRLKRKKKSLMKIFRLHLDEKNKCPGTYQTDWFAYPFMESFLGGKYECDSTNQSDDELQENTSLLTHQVTPDLIDNRPKNVLAKKITTRLRHRPSVSQTNGDHEYIFAKKEPADNIKFYQPAEHKNEMDEYELYGQLLAKKLRKLDEHQRDVAMHEIDNVMFRIKVQKNSSLNQTYVSPSGSQGVESPVFLVTQPGEVQYEDQNVSYEVHIQEEPPTSHYVGGFS